jgi:uncharacterized protein YbjT (DUF2867 family)
MVSVFRAGVGERFTMKPNPSDLFCRDLPTKPRPEIGKILVTGATGYIGGRLVPELLHRGYSVRVMLRAPLNDKDRWPGAEAVVADASEPDSLEEALEGIHTAYYLIHSMLLGKSQFEAASVQASINFRNYLSRWPRRSSNAAFIAFPKQNSSGG